MTIIHISTKQSWRGGEQQIAYLISELKKEGVDQIVMTPNNSKLSVFCKDAGIQVCGFSKYSGINIPAAIKLKKLCKSYEQPLIHAHDSHAHTTAFLSSILAGNKTPQIISRRVDFPVHKNLFSRKKYNSPHIKRILCVSEKIKEVTSPSIRNTNVLKVVYSGIDLDRFKECHDKKILRNLFKIPEENTIIGNVAALAPHKDYFTFVDTAEEILKKHPETTFLIIGQGSEKQKIAEYIFEKGLQNALIFTGFRTDIPDILPELDIYLMTSETEGLGTSILDAYACEVPVVATRAGGIPEIVTHEKTGLLAEIKNPVQLANNVIRLIEDETLKNNLVKEAKKEILNFTRQQTARKTMEEYKQVISETY